MSGRKLNNIFNRGRKVSILTDEDDRTLMSDDEEPEVQPVVIELPDDETRNDDATLLPDEDVTIITQNRDDETTLPPEPVDLTSSRKSAVPRSQADIFNRRTKPGFRKLAVPPAREASLLKSFNSRTKLQPHKSSRSLHSHGSKGINHLRMSANFRQDAKKRMVGRLTGATGNQSSGKLKHTSLSSSMSLGSRQLRNSQALISPHSLRKTGFNDLYRPHTNDPPRAPNNHNLKPVKRKKVMGKKLGQGIGNESSLSVGKLGKNLSPFTRDQPLNAEVSGKHNNFMPKSSLFRRLRAQRETGKRADLERQRQEASNMTLMNSADVLNKTDATLVTKDSRSRGDSATDLDQDLTDEDHSKGDAHEETEDAIAARERRSMAIADVVSRHIDPRDVRLMMMSRQMGGQNAELMGPRTSTALDVVNGIRAKQKEQDEILGRLYRSRQFRNDERSMRGRNGANVRASAAISLNPLIKSPHDPQTTGKDQNRTDYYKKYGMLGYGVCAVSAVDHGFGRFLDLIDAIPYDAKMISVILLLAAGAAYVAFYFTIDYSYDTLGLS